MDSIVVWNKIQLRAKFSIVNTIFHTRCICGCHQISGNARGGGYPLTTPGVLTYFNDYFLKGKCLAGVIFMALTKTIIAEKIKDS